MRWRVIGLLSGTSMDGIDVAAAVLRLDGDAVELTPLGFTEVPYPSGLRERLLAALPPAGCDARELCALDTAVGQAFAEAAHHGVDVLAGGRADLIGSLGQTLYHWVDEGRARGTLQLGQPAWIAEKTGLPVVADLRARDIAAGGHGAPLASMLDSLWLADQPGTPVALNIGGIANITVAGTPPVAYDTGPGNALIDAAANLAGLGSQDTGGQWAASGRVRADLLDRLLADPYYKQPPPKSTGKEHFNAEYVRPLLAERSGDHDHTADVLATLTELTAVTIADACREHRATRVIASGGGLANPALRRALERHLDAELVLSDDLGLPAAGKEAYLAALLGFLTCHGLPGNVPATTGASDSRMLGSITPGQNPWQPPPPATRPVRKLRVSAHDLQEASCDPSIS